MTTDLRASDGQVRRLAAGVTITTVAQRDGKRSAPLTAPTRPCVVERGPDLRREPNQLRFVLEEGRNRQIRKMCEKVGLTVLMLHRVRFCGVGLDGCPRPGSWAYLSDEELDQLGVE